MKTLYIIILFFAVIVAGSCRPTQWTVTGMSGIAIPLDANVEEIADVSMKEFLAPYKELVDAQMNEVIGVAARPLLSHRPESLLSNFASDIYLKAASEYLGEQVDIAIVNFGGLRAPLPQGNITVGHIFEIMPFQNELVIVYLTGKDLLNLLQRFAAIGGQGVAGLRLGIKSGVIGHVSVRGEALKADAVYSIATNNYLAEGNDHMPELANSERQVDTGILIRDMLINHIKELNDAGRKIDSQLDGRTYLMK